MIKIIYNIKNLKLKQNLRFFLFVLYNIYLRMCSTNFDFVGFSSQYSYPNDSYYRHRQPLYPYKSCNPHLAAANQLAVRRRHTCSCCCNTANNICRNRLALRPWTSENSTGVTSLPQISNQFGSVYSRKPCPGKCDRPRKCHPLCH